MHSHNPWRLREPCTDTLDNGLPLVANKGHEIPSISSNKNRCKGSAVRVSN